MIYIATWKKGLITALCLLGIWLALPNAFYNRVEMHNDALAKGTPSAQWPAFMPANIVNLGLDLRGGAHLLAEVALEDVYASRIDNLWPQLRDSLKDLRADIGAFRRVEGASDALRVRISNPQAMEKALSAARGLTQPVASFAAAGERDYTVSAQGDILTMTLSEAEKMATDGRTMAQTLEIIRRRIDEAGTREPVIQRQGNDRVLIQVPGIGSAEELKELIGTTAQLSFHHVIRQTADADTFADIGTLLVPSSDEEGRYYLLDSAAIFTGENLTNAQPSFDQKNSRPIVTFSLDITGARAFGNYTSENTGALMASVLDGEVIQAASINEPILGGNAQISGRFTTEESTRLAVLFRAGALPAELTFIEERTVGPDLGADSIAAGKIASIIALAFVLVYLVLSYGLFGVFAGTALIINITLIFAVLSTIGATLTLPGIAGIVLTIGMAVDANVLIFERIREETRVAKGPARAIDVGYDRAMSAILDANITTFLTALILFALGAGPVRGFAVTLGVGIITSVFTAIFVTRLMIVVWFERTRPKRIEV